MHVHLYQIKCRQFPRVSITITILPTRIITATQLKTYIISGYHENLVSGWLKAIGQNSFLRNILQHEADSEWWDRNTMSAKFNLVTSPAVHLAGLVILIHDSIHMRVLSE